MAGRQSLICHDGDDDAPSYCVFSRFTCTQQLSTIPLMNAHITKSPLFIHFTQTMNRILASKPEIILIALSGGMDSVSLIHLVHIWHTHTNHPAPLLAAHVNHCLRGRHADNDETFCRNLAKTLSMQFACQKTDAAAIAKHENIGIEEAGRRIRYRFFHSLIGRRGIALTGHHANDQVETILMNLHRGAHARGLAGMKETGLVRIPPNTEVQIGRPFLNVFRDDLLALANEYGWHWREDATNAETDFHRNRIRLRVVPVLEKLIPGFSKKLLDRADAFRRENKTQTEKARELLSRLCRKENGGMVIALDGAAVAEVGEDVAAYVVREAVEAMTGSRVASKQGVKNVVALAVGGRLNETVMLKGGVRVRRERTGLFLSVDGVRNGEETEEVWWLPQPPFVVQRNGVEISAEWVAAEGGVPEEDRLNDEVQWFNEETICLPLCFRAPGRGERFKGLGAPGGRKIHDLLVDLKVPRRLRGDVRVLADKEGVLWVWPYRMGERGRVGEKCARALRVRIRPLMPQD